MVEWNSLTLILVLALLALWNLDLVATLLNLKAFPTNVPKELATMMDQAKLDRARDYLKTNAQYDIIHSISLLMCMLVFWFVGGFGWLDQVARHISTHEITIGLVYLSAIFLGHCLISLPFSIYETFGIEQKFGFNRSTPMTFVTDSFKTLLLAAVIGLPLATAVLWIFNQISHAWLWAWLVVTCTQLVLAWLAPTLIMPLFNKFSPMPEGELKTEIEALGKRCGFPLDGVFVMDGSKRSSKANAFFTGFGKRKKIALFDTLIEKCSIPELLGVLAHEIGHFRRGHIKQRLVAGILQSAVIFYLLGIATTPDGKISRLLFDAFHIEKISPHVGLILFAIVLEPATKLLSVLLNAWSRKHEFEADAYAAEVTGDGKPLASALKKMTTDHLSHPSPAPLRVWLDYSHPPLLARLRALTTAENKKS